MIVEHLFDAWIVCIRCIFFLSYACGKEEEEEQRRRRRKKKNKIKIFVFNFLDCEEKSRDSGGMCDMRIAKGFHL